VSILDDGIQTNHPDLALNYVSTPYMQFSAWCAWTPECLPGSVFFCSILNLRDKYARKAAYPEDLTSYVDDG
jgi:hypothetical protein